MAAGHARVRQRLARPSGTETGLRRSLPERSYREGKRMKGILAWLIGIPIPIIIILYLIDVF